MAEEEGPKLANDLEEITDEEFQKDLKRFKETHTEENFAKIENYVADSHDKAYIAFKGKFEELANHKDDPLAKMGEELSDKHLNDLLEVYVHEFIKGSHGKAGEAMVESYKNLKFENESDRAEYIEGLAGKAGLIISQDRNKNPFHLMQDSLKKNKNRHHSVINDHAGSVKQATSLYHKSLLWQDSLGKSKYQKRNDMLKKVLEDLSGGRYNVDHDNDGKSNFYQHDIHKMQGEIQAMHMDKQDLNKDQLKDYGLKVKLAEYKD